MGYELPIYKTRREIETMSRIGSSDTIWYGQSPVSIMFNKFNVNASNLVAVLNGPRNEQGLKGAESGADAQILRLAVLTTLCETFSKEGFKSRSDLKSTVSVISEAKRFNANLSEQEAEAILMVLGNDGSTLG